jgi:hypothetical protein
MQDSLPFVAVLAVGLFSGWNLWTGIRTGRTWMRFFHNISRRETPWSYWAAILMWALFTATPIAALILHLLGLPLVPRR